MSILERKEDHIPFTFYRLSRRLNLHDYIGAGKYIIYFSHIIDYKDASLYMSLLEQKISIFLYISAYIDTSMYMSILE
jgi:hypothetical protein